MPKNAQGESGPTGADLAQLLPNPSPKGVAASPHWPADRRVREMQSFMWGLAQAGGLPGFPRRVFLPAVKGEHETRRSAKDRPSPSCPPHKYWAKLYKTSYLPTSAPIKVEVVP